MQVTDERNLETIPVGPLGIIPLESCKELGGDEGIGQFRTKIVDDQKVTVKNVGMHVFRLFFRFRTLEGRPSQKIKKLEGGKIDDRMSCL